MKYGPELTWEQRQQLDKYRMCRIPWTLTAKIRMLNMITFHQPLQLWMLHSHDEWTLDIKCKMIDELTIIDEEGWMEVFTSKGACWDMGKYWPGLEMHTQWNQDHDYLSDEEIMMQETFD